MCWDDEGIEDDHEDELDSVDPRPLSPRSYENMNATFATARYFIIKMMDRIILYIFEYSLEKNGKTNLIRLVFTVHLKLLTMYCNCANTI